MEDVPSIVVRPVTASPPLSPSKYSPIDQRLKSGPSSNNAESSRTAGSPTSIVDPLSQHIIERIGTPISPATTKSKSSGVSDALAVLSSVDSISTSKSSSEDLQAEAIPAAVFKDRKKSTSFFSRLIGHKKRENSIPLTDPSTINTPDHASERGDGETIVESFDGMTFSPRYPQPPPYIKTQALGKKKKDFDKVFLAQELQDAEKRPRPLERSDTNSSTSRLRRVRTNEETNAVWALEFSKDGKFVAVAGQDKSVRVWSTLQSRNDRQTLEFEEEASYLKAPVFAEKPHRVYEGHTSPILDLSWSKNNFLLSSSMDKTVRLWHVSRADCLCAFKHMDFVTSIQFHPKDDRFFLAGSLDSKLRLWSIPDKSVAFWNQLPEMVTAVSFTPDGKTAIAGCLTGLCMFYETEGLKYQTQIHVKSAHGKNAKGSKITGIDTINFPPSDPHGEVKILITSNDSRIRMFNLRDKSLEVKFKGNENSSSQIHARFSDDARYIICGSEDKRVFIWSLTEEVRQDRKEKQALEVFEAHNAATTVCAIAPTRLRQLLNASEDPLYDLCNPPPVTLMSRAEVESMHSGPAPDSTPSPDVTPPTEQEPQRQEDTPAYAARSMHSDGNIIVTADAFGTIKVFRQDCAYEKRTQWEPDTRKFSSASYLRRNSSMASSKRSRSRQDSSSSSVSHDRIMSWQQTISTTGFEGVNGARHSPVLGGNGQSANRSSTGRKFSLDPRAHRIGMFGGGHGIGSITSPDNRKASVDSPSPQRGSGSPQRTSPKRGDRSSMPPPPKPHMGRVIAPTNENETESPSKSSPHLESSDQLHAPRPEISRTSSTNSNTYWERDAWHEQIMAQVKGAKAHREEHVGADGHSGTSGSLRVSRQGSVASALTDEALTPEEQERT